MSSDSAAKVPMALLRKLHRIQRQKTDLQSQLQRGPRQIEAGKRLCEQQRVAAEEAVEKLKKAKLAADEKQLQLKSREDRIAELESKLNTASSNKEYSSLKEQIAADRQANEVLSDEILEALERIDVLEEERQARAADLTQRESDHEELVGKVQEKMTKLESELERVERELHNSEEELPAKIKHDYTRMVAARGEEALAPVEGEHCGGCHQSLTSQKMNQLYLEHAVVCSACGAMLYLPEGRKAT